MVSRARVLNLKPTCLQQFRKALFGLVCNCALGVTLRFANLWCVNAGPERYAIAEKPHVDAVAAYRVSIDS